MSADPLATFAADLAAFATERDWDQYHTPRNLVLALVSEVGELAELYRWNGPINPVDLSDELADVLIFLVRLATVEGVDLLEAGRAKVVRNAERFPALRSLG